MYSIKVGEIYYNISSKEEGSTLGIFNHSFMLVISVANCSEKIIEKFNKYPFELSLAVKDNIMFLLHKFGNISWSDSTFEVNCYDNFNFEYFDTSRMVVFLCDANSQMIKGINILELNNDFSKALSDELDRQLKEKDFNYSNYVNKVHKIFEQYSSNDLNKFSHAHCKCKTISTDELIIKSKND